MSTEHRHSYWNTKYMANKEDWHEDIHFAIFPNLTYSEQSFKEGIKLNTELLAKDIIESSSIYNLANKPKILDFACGAGDLLFKLSSGLQSAECFGIDISDSAIEKAKNKADKLSDASKRANMHFYQGGVEQLGSLMSVYGEKCFDVIICRDAYYLFAAEEQQSLLTIAGKLLKDTGLFFLSDISVADTVKDQVDEHLIVRQFGGVPISCHFEAGGSITFSIQNAFKTFGMEQVRCPQVDMTSVGWSYQAAAAMTSTEPEIKTAYLELVKAANTVKKNNAWISNLPYVSFLLKPLNNTAVQDSKKRLGLRLNKDFLYKSASDKVILKQGEYLFPVNEWSLIIGKSGVGKSTLLNLVAGMIKEHKQVEKQNVSAKIFYLKQKPVLIRELTVEANLSIFAQDKSMVSDTLTNLGLGGSIRKRTVDHNLSGGEEQRVALGQAIVSQPDILLLDEPCTGVDKVIKYQFFSAIKSQFHEKPLTLLCVDHDYNMIQSFFDNIFEIINGKLYLIDHI